VTDEGLKALSGLKNLTYQVLEDTQVTDQGVQALAEMESLRRLDLSGTKVTKAGIAKIQKALPSLKILNP
jgi:hypothetical protein